MGTILMVDDLTPRISLNLFFDLGRMTDWVGRAAQGDCETWLSNHHGESNPGHSQGRATV